MDPKPPASEHAPECLEESVVIDILQHDGDLLQAFFSKEDDQGLKRPPEEPLYMIRFNLRISNYAPFHDYGMLGILHSVFSKSYEDFVSSGYAQRLADMGAAVVEDLAFALMNMPAMGMIPLRTGNVIRINGRAYRRLKYSWRPC